MPSLGPGLPIYGQKSGLTAPRWRTAAERAGAVPAPGEFEEGAAEAPEGLGRRSFLQVLGASAALAGLQACRPPREPLVPYVRPPAGVLPSIPSAYATAASDGGYAVGLVVTSWEGRPTKIEGNPAHPASRGGTDAIRQALVLDLYDPARLAGFRVDGRELSFAGLLQQIALLAEDHAVDDGARLRFLAEPTSSPTVGELRRRILERFPRARFDAWSAVQGPGLAGAALAFGRPLEPVLALPDADVILSLEADLLARDGDPLRQTREFAARRVPGKLNRLYVAEAGFTVTGGMADHRLRMRSAEVAGFARAVAGELARAHGFAALAPLGAPAEGPRQPLVAAVAKDLALARGRSLVAVGAGQPAAVHALAHAMNAALGNVGRTVRLVPPGLLDPDAGPDRLRALARELEAGQVETLVVTAWNPLHTAPADLDLRRLMPRARRTIVHALRDDETVRAATWKLAAAHPLESWGDLRARDGTASIVQPLITPLVASLTEIELLAAFLGEGDRGAYRLVRDGWRARAGAPPPPPPVAGSQAAATPPAPAGATRVQPPDPFQRRWEEWLAAGIVADGAKDAGAPGPGAPDGARIAAALAALPAPAGGLEVRFVPDYKLGDGRFYENAWLQEFPDPVTKLTWDNAAHLSPATARRLGVADGDVVTLSRAGRSVEAPVLAVPGHADDSVTLTLGWGQRVRGAVGKGGFDAYALRTSDALAFAGGLEVKPAGRRVDLAVTQGHFGMEVAGHERPIALMVAERELDHAQVELEHLRGPQPDILPEVVDYSKQEYRWGMAIDLSRCVGCAACTLACQAENNIPVVGKEQVLRSREMHWLRVDRYFEGPPEDPASVTQPLMCVHCEKAPCEYVCPVNATVHSDEGLNEMVYNRCVGTRYCSNNCPYKVRRFNWLDFHREMTPSLKLLQNPDVTVRARGVMEKCTYCTQRIERARIDARIAGRKIGPDEVVPACAQACPAEAIVFGNLNEPQARVTRLHADSRRYDLLHELGTKPRTAYLVKLRNPNPELA
jgi:molybdopterin-containing oxidoreductase family iron-sulfur binding subunit